MLRVHILGVCLILSTVSDAATDSKVLWPNLTVNLNIAASRMDVPFVASEPTCAEGRKDPCRWTTRDNIDFEAESDGSGHLHRIEVSWSGDDHPEGATAFRNACAAVASLVLPRWSKGQVSAALTKTMVIANVRGSAPERQQTVNGTRLFGDRNARSDPSQPGAAFLQCGAALDF